MRAILVSVEYDDILSITLPCNRHHFDDVMVVTTPDDKETIKVALDNQARVCETNAFFDDGAYFNKWKALEYALDIYGRHGLMCIMDADVLWPKKVKHPSYILGCLYTPQRYLWFDVSDPIPSEAFWVGLPVGHDVEWAGYTQIFYADDPHLPNPPWHEVNWRHAGGADSFFQQLWPQANKLRPSWRVLHLGLPGRNWCGRTTARSDGKEVTQAAARRERLQQMVGLRRFNTRDPYAAERLG